jgi:1-acyl-sn-glycerol-3-phosphate acyltransferase
MTQHTKISVLQKFWCLFCRTVVSVFYRQHEISGLHHIPANGPVLLCANHANALADAVLIQAVTARTVHPIVRSGLFNNPFLKIILLMIQAVPVYRKQDAEGGVKQNQDSFTRCYELLRMGECLLIFPEGQSHSDPKLRSMKSGGARLVLGAIEQGVLPTVIPIGLNFSNKGKFRSRVLIKIHPALDLSRPLDSTRTPSAVRALTEDIQNALESVTLNADRVQDIDFLQRVERFFAMRHGKYRQRSLDLRFKALKKIAQAYDQLCANCPARISQIKRQLQQFERMCNRWGIRDYHLTITYRPTIVTNFILRSIFVILFVLPLAAWGILNSIIPFLLTRHIARRISKGADQYDTAKMVLGLFFFWLFWFTQTAFVYLQLNAQTALVYAISLPPSAGVALFFRNENERIRENLRVFFLFIRKKKLKRYLVRRREKIEHELAQLVRMAKRTQQRETKG